MPSLLAFYRLRGWRPCLALRLCGWWWQAHPPCLRVARVARAVVARVVVARVARAEVTAGLVARAVVTAVAVARVVAAMVARVWVAVARMG
jgi:hypothetical protein